MVQEPEILDPNGLREIFPAYEFMDLAALDSQLHGLDEEFRLRAQRKKEEEERERARRAAATDQLATEVLALHERLKKSQQLLQALRAEGPEDDLAARMQMLADEIKARIGTLVNLVGFDPLERQERARKAAETRERLIVASRSASGSGQLRTVLNEVGQALDFMDTADARTLLDQVEERDAGDELADVIFQLRSEIHDRSDPGYAAREATRLEDARQRARKREGLSQEVSALLEEVRNGTPYLESFTKEEVLNQICLWAGKARILQEDQGDMSSEASDTLVQIFGILTKVSKDLQPGFCEALSRAIHKDWREYVEKQQRDRVAIIQRAREARELREQQRVQEEAAKIREEERRKKGADSLDELRAVVYQTEGSEGPLSSQDAEVFREAVLTCLKYLPGTHAGLMDIVRPYAMHLHGKEFKALRRGLGRTGNGGPLEEFPDEPRTPEVESLIAAAMALWQGKRVALVGGRRRPDVADDLEECLQVDDLRWVETADDKPRALGSLIQSIRSGGTDAVVLLTDFIGHNTAEVRETCESVGVPCLLASGSIGIRVILQALSRTDG